MLPLGLMTDACFCFTVFQWTPVHCGIVGCLATVK